MTAPGVAHPLVGRAAELDRLDAAMDEVRVAGPRVVLCSGAVGVGKTALLRLFADRAAEHGATVMWPRAFGRPGAPPYWIWQQVAGPNRLFGSPPLSADRAAIAERIADQLRSVSAGQPTVLVLDDLDRVDDSSLLTTLPRVLRALGRSHLLVCCAYASDAPHTSEWSAMRHVLKAEAATEEMLLTGLMDEDVWRLLISSGLAAPGPDLVDQVAAITAGNPLFIVELARHLTLGGPDRPEVPLPRTLGDLVRHRLDALPESARRVLGAASILGERFRIGDLARALGLDAAVCSEAVDEAVRVGFVAPVSAAEAEFRHALFREIVESRLRTSERIGLHRRVAEGLEAAGRPSGDELGVLAYHWAAAAAGGASTEACSWARRAADEAMRARAYEDAERLYLVPLDHASDLPELDQARLRLARGTAALRSGHLVVAREACAAAVNAARHNGSRDLLASAALTLEPVGDPAWDGDIHAWCAEALAEAGQDPSTQVRLLARLSQSAAYLRLDEKADRASAEALQRAADLSDTEARVDALIARQLVRSGPDDVGELGELADQMLAVSASTGRADLEMWGRLWRIDTHWYAGRLSAIASETAGLQRCDERTAHSAADARRSGTMTLRAAISRQRAPCAVRSAPRASGWRPTPSSRQSMRALATTRPLHS